VRSAPTHVPGGVRVAANTAGDHVHQGRTCPAMIVLVPPPIGQLPHLLEGRNDPCIEVCFKPARMPFWPRSSAQSDSEKGYDFSARRVACHQYVVFRESKDTVGITRRCGSWPRRGYTCPVCHPADLHLGACVARTRHFHRIGKWAGPGVCTPHGARLAIARPARSPVAGLHSHPASLPPAHRESCTTPLRRQACRRPLWTAR